MNHFTSLAVLGLGVVAVDQLSKFAAQFFFAPWINTRGSLWLSLLGILAALFSFWLWRARPHVFVAPTLLLAGGISNMIDRLVAGGVIDIFQVADFNFNLADVTIIAGAVLLLAI